MSKKIVFEGTVNGKKFDNLNDYNEYVNRLIGMGQFVEASTCSKVVDEENEIKSKMPEGFKALMDAIDEYKDDKTVSLLPYMEEGDPFYLNELIVDKDQDKVFEEVNNTLDECFENITEVIKDESICIEGLYDYLNDVENVIERVEGDLEKNDKALESIEKQLESLNDEVDALIAKIEVLDNAKTIIEGMHEFYTDLEDAIYEEINSREFVVEDEDDGCKCAGKCNGECKCGKECQCQCQDCETHIEEKQSQREFNLNDIINMVFGDGRKIV